MATKPHYPRGDIPVKVLEVALRDEEYTATQLETVKNQILELLHRETFTVKIEEQGKSREMTLSALQKRAGDFVSAVSGLREKHQIAQKMRHLMGKAVAVSGKSILGRRIIDWAFVELTDEAAKE